MATVTVEYRIKGYRMADALRPNPMWGKRIFTANTADLGTEDMNEISRMARAKDAVPDGYEFYGLKIH